MVGSLALYGRLVTLASARSRRQFAPHSRRGLWGWPFDRLVHWWRKRTGRTPAEAPPVDRDPAR